MNEVTVVDVVVAVVATAAFVLSLINVRLTGSYVSVTLQGGMTAYGGGPSFPPGPYVSVTARNSGRTQVAVTQVGVVAVKRRWARKGKVFLANPVAPTGPQLPHTIEPGHSASWMLDQSKLAAEDVAPTGFRGVVALGTGRTRYCRSLLRLHSES